MKKAPKPNSNEQYAGTIIKPDGTGHHFFLIAGDNEEASHEAQMAWAKEQGGDLPDRVETALMFQTLKGEFKEDWYWTNEKHASESSWAWFQHFDDGRQDISLKNDELRARAVRRVVI